MRLVTVQCAYCIKDFKRTLRQSNEASKFGWKQYCSKACLNNDRNLSIEVACENQNCKRTFRRSPSEISPRNYCSHSCAAIIGNIQKRVIRVCQRKGCNNQFNVKKKYCSTVCVPHNETQYTKKSIAEAIINFGRIYKRVPTKRELGKLYGMARRYFGTWNNAIRAAGLTPNPVMFANKHIALDGHKCDSLAERIIDDWLFRRNIPHERNVPYPGRLGLKTDFLVKDYWIEFFGLSGELKRYDYLKRKKLALIKRRGLKLIKIYPKHLFPKGKLDEILGIHLNAWRPEKLQTSFVCVILV